MKAEQIDISWWSFSQNPYNYYNFLKTNQGVNYLPKNKGWIITNYHEIVSILNQPQRFSSEGENSFDPILLNCDPPKHTVHRKVIAGEKGVFSNTRISELYQTNQEIAKALIEPLKEKESFDLLSEFAIPFSSLVILKILGFNEDILESVKEWSASAISSKSIHNLNYSNSLWKKLEPDLKAWVLDSENSASKNGLKEFLQDPTLKKSFNDKQLLHLVKVILLGGNETTPNLVSSALFYLLKNQETLARIKADYSLLDNFINEILRLEAPTQIIQRNCTQDTEVGGQNIKKGSLIYLSIGAGNRDHSVFDSADKVDLNRSRQKILSFGFGPHYCLGAHLAKQEAIIMLTAILSEFTNLNLLPNQSFEYRHSSHVRGLKKLWVSNTHVPNKIDHSSTINKAIKTIKLNQLASGEFPTYEYFPDHTELSKKGWHRGHPSPFVHSNILYSLKQLDSHEFTKEIKKGLDFLCNTKEEGDVWRFWKLQKGINNVPPDLDDTSVASFVLCKSGVQIENKGLLELHLKKSKLAKTWLLPKPYLIWFSPNLWLKWQLQRSKVSESIRSGFLDINDFELGVMANVLLYLGESRITKATIETCIRLWKEKQDPANFYHNRLVVAYHLARAYHHGITQFESIKDSIIKEIKNNKEQFLFADLLLGALCIQYFKGDHKLIEALKTKIDEWTFLTDFDFSPVSYFTSKDRNFHAGSKALTAAWYLELMHS